MRSRLALGVLLLPVLLYSVSLASVYSFSLADETVQADAAIVLGAAVFRSRPSPVFEERIRHGVNLYHQGIVEALIFTGSIGRRDELSEAAVARNYAIQLGVPPNDIYIEELSTETFENLLEAKSIIDREGFVQILLVSDPLHMRRALTMASDIGISAYSSPTPTSRYISVRTRLLFLLRESYFYSTYLLTRSFLSA